MLFMLGMCNKINGLKSREKMETAREYLKNLFSFFSSFFFSIVVIRYCVQQLHVRNHNATRDSNNELAIPANRRRNS